MILALLLAAVAPDGFAPIEHLVGHCWRGTLSNGAIDTHCWTREDGGRTVIDRHVAEKTGAPPYRGETRYTVADGKLRWAYRNTAGPVSAGEVVDEPGGLWFTAEGQTPIGWRWKGPRAYAAQVGPDGELIRFERVD